MPSYFSCVQLFVTSWTVAHQAPLFTRFSRQEHWSRLPCPLPGNLSNSGIEPVSLMSPALASIFFTTEPLGKPPLASKKKKKKKFRFLCDPLSVLKSL